MGMNLDDVLSQAKNGSSVHVTIVSNQDNGIASYGVGDLVFHSATGGQVLGGPLLHPAHMESAAGSPLTLFFSDRKLAIDPAPAPGSFGGSPRQPFSANATEALGMRVAPGLGIRQVVPVTITVFGNSVKFDMEPRGNVLVGVGPPLGPSPEAVYVLSFTGITHPPA
jgi:hypothetical protein